MSAVILIDFLSPEYLPIMIKGASFIEGLFCGTVYLLVLLGLQHCCHSKIVILILDIFLLYLISVLFCVSFCLHSQLVSCFVLRFLL